MFVIDDEQSAAYPTAELRDALEIARGPHKQLLPKKKTDWLDRLPNYQFEPDVSVNNVTQWKCQR